MKLKIKKLNELAKIPVRAKEGDVGFDLVATSVQYNKEKDYIEYGTGLGFEIPEGYFGMICARSSISDYDLQLTNGVGIIDSGYRGEVKLRFKIVTDYVANVPDEQSKIALGMGKFPVYNTPEMMLNGFESFSKVYKVGDKIGQLIIFPITNVNIEEVQELSETERGDGGFGSSGE